MRWELFSKYPDYARFVEFGPRRMGPPTRERRKHEPIPGETILTREEFDRMVDGERGDEAEEHSGWFCIRTSPWPCPAEGCGFVARFVTVAHLIVVWPRKDDSVLLQIANDCVTAGRQPRVAEYEESMGRCITYDEWVRIGRPVHGVAETPAGWDERTRI